MSPPVIINPLIVSVPGSIRPAVPPFLDTAQFQPVADLIEFSAPFLYLVPLGSLMGTGQKVLMDSRFPIHIPTFPADRFLVISLAGNRHKLVHVIILMNLLKTIFLQLRKGSFQLFILVHPRHSKKTETGHGIGGGRFQDSFRHPHHLSIRVPEKTKRTLTACALSFIGAAEPQVLPSIIRRIQPNLKTGYIPADTPDRAIKSHDSVHKRQRPSFPGC